MSHFYFHCHSGPRVLVDQCGANVDDLIDAHDHAVRAVQALVATAIPEDWRDWELCVSDELGGEVLSMPFSSILGKPH